MTQEQTNTQPQAEQVPDVFGAMFQAAETKLQQNYALMNQAILQHMVDVNFMCNAFTDTTSRNKYTQRLLFLSFQNMNPLLKQHFSGFCQENKEAVKQHFEKLKAAGKVPDFNLTKIPAYQDDLQNIFGNEQAIFPGQLEVEPGEVVLNCGASLGFCSAWFYLQGAKDVYSFEVDDRKIPYLQQNLNLIGKGNDNQHIINYAVSNVSGSVWFSPKDGVSIEKPEQQDTAALSLSVVIRPERKPKQCSSLCLDDWCAANHIKPTFIRFDLNGSEFNAIKGASNVIKAFKPKLVIRLDSKLQNMWEIPVYLDGLLPEYKYYARTTNDNRDFFLYAVAK